MFQPLKPYLALAGLALGIAACGGSSDGLQKQDILRSSFHSAQSCQDVENFAKTYTSRARQFPQGVVTSVEAGPSVNAAPPSTEAATHADVATPAAPAAGTSGSKSSVVQSDIAFSDVERGLIYAFDGKQNLKIFQVTPAGTSGLRSKIALGFQPSELVTLMAHEKNYAVIFGSDWTQTVQEGIATPLTDVGMPVSRSGENKFVVSILDVTHLETPVEVRREMLPGDFLEARVLPEKSSVLWVSQRYIPTSETSRGQNPLLPKKQVITAEGNSEAEVSPCDQIYLYQDQSSNSDYSPSLLNATQVSFLNLQDPRLTVSTRTIFSPAWRTMISANSNHLFLAQSMDGANQETELYQFDLPQEDKDLNLSASGLVPGDIPNQFFIHEEENTKTIRIFHHKGNNAGFFASPCDNCGTSGTPIPLMRSSLSPKLEEDLAVGNYASNYKVEGNQLILQGRSEVFEPTEDFFAARFTGNIGCSITFIRRDPLTCFDFSTPTPTKLGNLEIDGVSRYLEAVTPTLFLGIGEGSQNGSVVANLFDISDPANPKLASQIQLSQSQGWASSPVFYDYRGLSKAADHLTFAVPLEERASTESSIALFKIDPTSKSMTKTDRINRVEKNPCYSNPYQRAFFMGDTLAALSYTDVEIYSGDPLTQIASIALNETPSSNNGTGPCYNMGI